jgi:hypothetical protein
MDFVSDQLALGRRFRTLNIVFVMLGVAGNALAIRRFLVTRKSSRGHQDIRDDSFPFPFAFAAVVTVMGAPPGGYLLVRPAA